MEKNDNYYRKKIIEAYVKGTIVQYFGSNLQQAEGETPIEDQLLRFVADTAEVDPEKLRRIREGWINGNKENVSGSTDKVLHSGGIALDGLL